MGQTLYNGADAAFPGHPLPPDTDVLAGYIGSPGQGRPDTPHIWTPAEWNFYVSRYPTLRLLPIYVHNYPDADPMADAANAVAAAKRLGWTANRTGTARRIIALDVETLVDPDWVHKVITGIWDGGYRCMVYGSAGYVTRNPAGTGYWEADYTGVRPTALGPLQLGRQYAANGDWDLDVFTQAAYDGFGHGERWA